MSARTTIWIAVATSIVAARAASAGPVCGGPDPHAKHLNGGLDCTVCHPAGGQFGFSASFSYPRGTSPAGGSITLTSPPTCAVACHSPMGGAPHTVSWVPGTLDCTACHDTSTLSAAHPAVDAQAPRSACEVCHTTGTHTTGSVSLVAHPASWMSDSDPGFHAFSANRGLGACQQCHLADLSGGVTGVSCAQCHDRALPQGVTSWKTNCVMCHGGRDNGTGAPPKATWGNDGDAVRTGAHSTHVSAGFDCALCHAKPADALSPGHIDGTLATVAFSGIASSPGASWNRSTATCATYCHGATLAGGFNPAPVWTRVGEGQAACGACHGVPPPAPHPSAASDLTSCNRCHALTIDPAGLLIPSANGGKHLDGVVEATGGHAASWMDRADPGFHAFTANRGLSACTSCHGQDLEGGSAGVSCASCHDANLPIGVASWKVNCVMCHGGTADATGAPPRATWGNEADAVRTGAHTRHVNGGAVATAFDCAVCHVKPADALAPAHIDGPTATVTWSGLASTSGANPSWDRQTGTCSTTYCHGGYSGTFVYEVWDYGVDGLVTKTAPYAGANASPTWPGAAMKCDSCHGNPPRATGTWHSGSHSSFNDCQYCHSDAVGSGGIGTAITDLSLHINGVVDVNPQFTTRCSPCH